MERLRLRAEEQKYHRLTNNLDKVIEDDVTTRSMTYAASIGMNMIVAPISFGVFVYFFAGHMFFKDAELAPGQTVHIGKVISAVVAGVGMMFIEMILFVIRSHELDVHTTKKKKKKVYEHGAFGSKLASQLAKQRESAQIQIQESENKK